MKIGIITAMPEEMQAVVRAIGTTGRVACGELNSRQGSVGSHEVIVVEAGMGFSNATAAAECLIQNARPDWIMSAGFCGGISAELRVGDVVLASGLTIVSGEGLEDVPVELPGISRDFAAQQAAKGQRVFAGMYASTAIIIQKRRLAMLLPVDAPFPVVEMESAAIARVAVKHRIPFCAVRTVSDPADEELGFSLDEFCDDRMRIRIHRVLLTIVRKPRIIPQLFRLARNSRVAAASLTESVAQLLAVM